MARIAVAWELGGGLGHLGIAAPIVTQLRDLGHEVTIISRNLATAAKLFGGYSISLFQAPVKIKKVASPVDRPVTYPDMLLNVGYENEWELKGLFRGWQSLFSTLKPDCVLLDHSPTAALTTLALEIPAFTIGTGFCQPPSTFPLPPMSWWRPHNHVDMAERESEIVDRIHRVIPSIHQPLTGIGKIFELVEGNLLTTFQELDHYPSRNGATYFGSWSPPLDRAEFPGWPSAEGKKIFAYLKRMPCLGDVIRWLSASGHSVIVVGDGIDFSPLQSLVSSRIRLLENPIDLAPIKAECDLAILNGNHGVTCEFLLAGIPLFQLPLMQEQSILTHVTVQYGCAIAASPNHVPQVISQLRGALEDDKIQARAREFAARYKSYDATANQDHIVTAITAVC